MRQKFRQLIMWLLLLAQIQSAQRVRLFDVNKDTTKKALPTKNKRKKVKFLSFSSKKFI